MTDLSGLDAKSRILVLGGPGAGKTTLARRISQQLGLPAYCLDDLGWRNHVSRTAEERQADIEHILQQARWVVDGIVYSWGTPLAEGADAMVWLEIPWRVAAWRIIRRHVLADLRRNNAHSGYRRLWKFLGWCRSYYTAGPNEARADAPQDTRFGTLEFLQRYREKVISIGV